MILRRVWHVLHPPKCPLCWVRPADLRIHLDTEHTEVELSQYLSARGDL